MYISTNYDSESLFIKSKYDAFIKIICETATKDNFDVPIYEIKTVTDLQKFSTTD